MPTGDDFANIRILDDGTIVFESPDQISAGNHMSADQLAKFLTTQGGGKVVKTRLPKGIAHEHTHTHEHTHN